MALAKASVLSVELSPLAPNLVISKSRLGKVGGLMRARIRGTSDHGSAAAANTSTADTASTAAPAAAIDFRNSRRFCIWGRSQKKYASPPGGAARRVMK